MIPLTFLHDEYIDRPKLTEQKKNPFECIVPPPTSGVGTKIGEVKSTPRSRKYAAHEVRRKQRLYTVCNSTIVFNLFARSGVIINKFKDICFDPS